MSVFSPFRGCTSGSRFLDDPDRAGMFVFTDGDYSTQVAADTAQGVYIPPDAFSGLPTDGSNGAWIRQFDGAVNVKWFGAVADNVTNDSAAFLGAIAYLESQSVSGFGYGKGTGTLFIPAGAYYMGTTTLDIYTAMTIRGEGFGENSGVSTVLRWADGATGIRVHEINTSGASSTRVADGRTGAGTIIERLMLQGGYSATEGEYHGIHLRTRATIQEVWVNVFSGDGLHIYCSAGSGGATEGNANNTFVSRSTFAGCRNGMFIQGADSNAGTFIMCNALYNHRWGIWDNSFLGNAHLGHHTSGNGVTGVGGSIPYTLVSNSSKHYSVVQGRETQASVNAPSGTTADTANWYYVRAGGVSAWAPAWVSGVSVRDGGPYFASTSEMTSCYSETDQAISQITGTASIGGTPAQFAGAKGGGKIETRYTNGFGVTSAMRITNTSPPNFSGPAGLDLFMYGGSAGLNAYDWNAAAFVPMFLDATTIDLQSSGSTIGTISSAGFNLAAGKVLKVNGTQVVGAQGAAITDAAGLTSVNGTNAAAAPTQAEFNALVAEFNKLRTDVAAVRTPFNTLLARERTHGLIAT